ncbi:transporter substrate-binding domain-containing protein [Devosia sp. Root635]|uniref:transporter substrate-binding domain-containing protein n=1 Tax=Devosia sp. Root635 TaxID=1736575 RepID=UPI0006FC8368|nr:transporter substrate-binding domain-containing protein [Devosia sp. Root635]KRA53044.1 amino acid ABC transporter [Devosia sp. Root635]
MKRRTLLGLAAAAIIVAAAPASAASLAEIQAAGKIRIAVVPGVPLFAFVDANLNLTGSDVEISRLIAKDLGVEIEFVEIANAARVPTIQAGTADILVGNLAITPQRQEVIDFTVPYSTLDIIVGAPERYGITGYESLEGQRVGVTRATVNDTLITEHSPNAEQVRFEDDATLITALASKQLDIVSTQGAVLAAINERRADDPLEVSFVQQSLDLGIALPKGQPELLAWLNDWVKKNFADGTLPKLFESFHGRELPADLVDRVH